MKLFQCKLCKKMIRHDDMTNHVLHFCPKRQK